MGFWLIVVFCSGCGFSCILLFICWMCSVCLNGYLLLICWLLLCLVIVCDMILVSCLGVLAVWFRCEFCWVLANSVGIILILICLLYFGYLC